MPTSTQDILFAIDSFLEKNESGYAYATFDFDGTCIQNDIQDILFNYMCRNNLFISKSVLENLELSGVSNMDANEFNVLVFNHYHSLCEEKKFIDAYKFCATTLAGYTDAEIFDMTRQALQEESSNISSELFNGKTIKRGFCWNTDVLDLIKGMRERKVDVWIVSGSPEVLINYMINAFTLEAKAIGVRLEKDEDGTLLPKTIEPCSMFDGKVKCIRDRISNTIKPLLAIGDTLNDEAILREAEFKVVKGKKEGLLELAKLEKWFILD